MTLGRRWPLPEKHVQYAFPSVALGGLEAGIAAGAIGRSIAKQVGEASLVITTAGTDEKVAKARDLGADAVINYTTGDFLAETMRLTDGRGVDVAVDVVGGDVFARSQQALAEGGRLVSVGRSGGQAPEEDKALSERKHQTVVTENEP